MPYQTNMSITIMIKYLSFLGILLVALSNSAHAQQPLMDSWQFQQQNRASIASLIRQVEVDSSNGVVAAQAASVTNLVCGGDGQSSARANATCIILNNAVGDVSLDQFADGDQSASSSVSSSINNGADEVLSLLDE